MSAPPVAGVMDGRGFQANRWEAEVTGFSARVHRSSKLC